MDKKALRAKTKGKPRSIEFILEKGQTLAEYNKLRKLWDKKLSAAGHDDIEFVDGTGQVSRYFQGYSSQGLASAYDWSIEEYYRRASLFLHHAPWLKLYPTVHHYTYKFIWSLWCEGLTYLEISVRLKKRQRKLRLKQAAARRRGDIKRKLRKLSTVGVSVFWVFNNIKLIEEQMHEWIRQNAEILDP